MTKRTISLWKREKGSAELNARLESGMRRIKKGPMVGTHYGEFVMDHIACPLLREDGLCMLQAENGHGALPELPPDGILSALGIL